MLTASGGANTHRGLIFSLGLLSAAYGRLYRKTESVSSGELFSLCREMTRGLMEDFSRPYPARTHGETLYARYGISGIRGEAASGFPHVQDALVLLRKKLDAGCSLNDAGVAVLLSLMAGTEDTNVIHRAGIQALREIQKELAAFLALNPSTDEIRAKALELDGDFIGKNISPGGCADLLAVTLFLWYMS
jgi:triphosphoribosyl-dephospho-CoA synthetase